MIFFVSCAAELITKSLSLLTLIALVSLGWSVSEDSRGFPLGLAVISAGLALSFSGWLPMSVRLLIAGGSFVSSAAGLRPASISVCTGVSLSGETFSCVIRPVPEQSLIEPSIWADGSGWIVFLDSRPPERRFASVDLDRLRSSLVWLSVACDQHPFDWGLIDALSGVRRPTLQSIVTRSFSIRSIMPFLNSEAPVAICLRGLFIAASFSFLLPLSVFIVIAQFRRRWAILPGFLA